MLEENKRLYISKKNKEWKKWGPYVSERQWGTVREDYSDNADAWGYISHDKARSYAYRWGEEAIAGYCDDKQILCLAAAFWNGKDFILKERLFGLTNNQGNHGEDVKEVYFHLESSPTHAYSKFLYKYPQQKFPYAELIKNNRRGRQDQEYEILDTNVFAGQKYWDIYIEFAKADTDDILQKITIHNRSNKTETLHVLPHVWFRNYWRHNPRYEKPELYKIDDNCIRTKSVRNGKYHLYHSGGTQLFCENETNSQRVFGTQNDFQYSKDAINDFVVYRRGNPDIIDHGTKAAVWFILEVPAGESREVKVRLSKKELADPWMDYEDVFENRIQENEDFYQSILPKNLDQDEKHIIQSAIGGLLWTKSFYYLDIYKWLFGEIGEDAPFRHYLRNFHWQHLTNRNIISMPDKWEYPWYAAWDLAFHTKTFAEVDMDFAKEQLLLMLQDHYMHPNGQIPAYEWKFSDVNPPVHSGAVWQIYQMDKDKTGKPDYIFLKKAFQRLLINFTWWVNQKDGDGTNLFEGGFLGLDNIGVFDRSNMPAGIENMQQADATSWMAKFSLEMLRISLELANIHSMYEDMAEKFFRHFLNIGWAMHNIGSQAISLWDDEDNFYYDVVRTTNGTITRMKVRSLVGIIPLFAVQVIHKDLIKSLVQFKSKAHTIIATRPDLAKLISRIEEENKDGNYLFSLVRAYRLEQILKRMLDENEFLSDYGVRSLSKYHLENPFVFEHHGRHQIHYEPGESTSSMFGGNSNWRGPIWFPINYLIIQSLRKFYKFYGPTYVYEFPTGSGHKLNLNQIANALTRRLLNLFKRDKDGKYRYHNDDHQKTFATDPHFRDHHLFYEFFHGENGRGLGASHQTGWSALIANLVLEMKREE